MIERSNWLTVLVIMAVMFAGIYLLGAAWAAIRHFSDLILLFFLAWLLAFVLLPVVRLLQAGLGLPKVPAAIVVYVLLLFLIALSLFLVVPVLLYQMRQFGNLITTYLSTSPTALEALNFQLEAFGLRDSVDTFGLVSRVGDQIQQLVSGLIQGSLAIVGGIASTVFAVVLTLVVSFYFVVDHDHIKREVEGLIPVRFREEWQEFAEIINRTFGGFVRGTLIQATIFGLGTGLIMWAFGLDFAVLGGITAGCLMIIPFFGPAIGMIMPILIGAFTPLPLVEMLFLALALVLLQIAVLNILSPNIMGRSVRLHPLLVLLALLVGIKEAGLVGAIFGIPIVAVMWTTAVYLLGRRGYVPAEVDVGSPEGNISNRVRQTIARLVRGERGGGSENAAASATPQERGRSTLGSADPSSPRPSRPGSSV